jgi:hypothetical protein
MTMNKARRAVVGVAVLGSMATGGLLGATLFAPTVSNAATTSTAGSTGSTGASGGFHSNEASAHEKTESAQREADENSGKAHLGGAFRSGGAPFHSNEASAHEKTESAAREAQEAAGQVPSVP